MNSFVTVVLCCPLCQISFYLCHTFLNLRTSTFYTSRLPKGLYLSESITSTEAFSLHLSHSYVLVQLPLRLSTWHPALVLFVTGTYTEPY